MSPPEYGTARTLRYIADAIDANAMDAADAVDSAGTLPAHTIVTVNYGTAHHAVDRVAEAIEAPEPGLRRIAPSWQYQTHLMGDRLDVLVFAAADEPPEAKRDRLRQELAELDAQIGGDTTKAAVELAEAAATGWRDEATGLISGPLPEPAS